MSAFFVLIYTDDVKELVSCSQSGVIWILFQAGSMWLGAAIKSGNGEMASYAIETCDLLSLLK